MNHLKELRGKNIDSTAFRMKLHHLSGANEKIKSIQPLILKEEYSTKEIEQLPSFEMKQYEWYEDITESNLSEETTMN